MDGLEERIDRKELARQRARKWRLDNPERAKANAVRTYVNNKEHYKKYRKQWAKDNAGRVRMKRMVGNNFCLFWWNRPEWLVYRLWFFMFHDVVGGERWYLWQLKVPFLARFNPR